MRVIRFQMDEHHRDYPVLATIRDEVAGRAGGMPSLTTRFPGLVRDAVDFVLDPVRTARTRVTELDNVEKTFIGLKLEHFVRDMLDVPKGLRDLVIAGLDVDIKNTVGANWSIPIETYRNSEPCLLMAVDDAKYQCWLGIILAKLEYLHGGVGNRDTKRGVSAAGFESIMWLVNGASFATSRFDGLDMARFRELRKIKGGNRRVVAFFTENQRKPIHRSVFQALLFDQDDYMKRLRGNGGARDALKKDGVFILSGVYDSVLIHKLGLPLTAPDEMISVSGRDDIEKALLLRTPITIPETDD